MRFDVQAVAREALDDARVLLEPKVKELGVRGVLLAKRFAALESDVHDTLAAIEASTSPAEVEELQADLEGALAHRRTMLLAAVAAELGSAEKAALDAALEVGTKVALIVARAFIPIP